MAGDVDETQTSTYAQFIKYRTELIELKQKSESSADKTMLTLSGGALALSLTFLNISPIGYHAVGFLVAAWITFAAALIATLMSFRTSACAMAYEIQALDREIATGEGAGKANYWDKTTHLLNCFALACFIIGTGLFVCFAKQNVDVIERIETEQQIMPQDKRLEEGLTLHNPPPPPPVKDTTPTGTGGDTKPASDTPPNEAAQ